MRLIAVVALVGLMGVPASAGMIYTNNFDSMTDVAAYGNTSVGVAPAPAGKAGNALHIWGEGGAGTVTPSGPGFPMENAEEITVLFRALISAYDSRFQGGYLYAPGEGIVFDSSGTVKTSWGEATSQSMALNNWYTVALHRVPAGVELFFKPGDNAVITDADYLATSAANFNSPFGASYFWNYGGGGDWYVADYTINTGKDFTIVPEPASLILLVFGVLPPMRRRS